MPDEEVLVTVNLRINKTGTVERDPAWEESLSNDIQKNQIKIREDIHQRVMGTLGERSFRVEGPYVGRGSVTILILLGIAYAGVRDYKTVRDSLDKIMSDVRQVLDSLLLTLGRDARVDDARYETRVPGPRTGLGQVFEGISLPLVFNLVLSNVILIGVLIWVVLPFAVEEAAFRGMKLLGPTQFLEMIALLLVLYVFGLVLANIVLMVLFIWTAYTNRR